MADIKAPLEIVIANGNFELNEMIAKIDMFCANGRLTIDEHDELIEKARAAATPEAAYDPLATRVTNLEVICRDLLARVEALEEAATGGSTGGETTETDIPEFKQPTCAIDVYNTGDKVLFEGKVYECLMDNCAYSPSAYPAGWQLVEEV